MSNHKSAQPNNTDEQIEEIKEKLAEIEHERWADWQAWCHKILRENCPSPELEKVLERWDRQIATPYNDLTEQEKQSDREQVDRYWTLITTLIDNEVTKARYEILNDLLEWQELWAATHDDPFNWYGAIKAMLVMKNPQKPFTQLEAKETK